MGLIDRQDIFGTAKWQNVEKRIVSSKKLIEWTETVTSSCQKLCSESVKLQSLELLHMPDSDQVLEYETEISTEHDLELWLDEEPVEYGSEPEWDPFPSSSSPTPRPPKPAKLRLLYGYLTSRTHAQLRFPFPFSSLQSIASKFHHSEEHVEGFINELLDDLTIRQWSGKLEGWYGEATYQAFYIRAPIYGFSDGFGNNGFCVLSAIYNPSTNVTQALLLCARRMNHLPAVISRLKTSPEEAATSPFFLATTLAKVALIEHRETLASAIKAIFGVSNQLGYTTPYETDEPILNAVGGEPMNMDFMLLTKNVQMILNTLSYTQEAIQRQLLMLKIYDEIDGGKAADRDMPRLENMKQVVAELRWDNESLMLLCQRNFVLANSLSAVIYNFLTLQEARVQRDLATSSKIIAEATLRDSSTMKTIAEATLKDSSAMKSIAVLTMVFLPATAVAGVLDTPFFDWNGSKLETRGFELFWIVTIPLTIAVLLVWILVARPEQEWTRRLKETWRGRDGAKPMPHSDTDDAGESNHLEKKSLHFKPALHWKTSSRGNEDKQKATTKSDIELGNIAHIASQSKTSLAIVDGHPQSTPAYRLSWTPSGTCILKTGAEAAPTNNAIDGGPETSEDQSPQESILSVRGNIDPAAVPLPSSNNSSYSRSPSTSADFSYPRRPSESQSEYIRRLFGEARAKPLDKQWKARMDFQSGRKPNHHGCMPVWENGRKRWVSVCEHGVGVEECVVVGCR